MGEVVPLSFLRPGETGEVAEVSGDTELVARLAEKGLRPGGKVEAVQHGEPMVVLIDGTRLTLRTDGKADVWIRASSIARGTR